MRVCVSVSLGFLWLGSRRPLLMHEGFYSTDQLSRSGVWPFKSLWISGVLNRCRFKVISCLQFRNCRIVLVKVYTVFKRCIIDFMLKWNSKQPTVWQWKAAALGVPSKRVTSVGRACSAKTAFAGAGRVVCQIMANIVCRTPNDYLAIDVIRIAIFAFIKDVRINKNFHI